MPKDLEDLDLDALDLVTGGVGGARPMRDDALAGLHASALGTDLPQSHALSGFGHASHIAGDFRPSSFGHDAMAAGVSREAATHEVGIAVCGVISPHQANTEDAAAFVATSSHLR